MDASSKIKLTQQAMQRIVKAQFGTQRELAAFEELKEGFFNAAALLTLDDGTRMVLKAAPPADIAVLRYEKDILRAEVEAMRLVQARTSIPIPEILAYDVSCRLLPSPYFLMSYVPGTSLHKLQQQLSDDQRTQIRCEMGRITREIGQISGPAFGYWAQPEAPGVSWRTCFTNMVEGVLRDGEAASVQLPLPYDEIRRRMALHSPALDEIITPRLVHWDLWDGNIFVDPLSGKITGLIDFERVLWGDPLIEAIFIDRNPDSQAIAGYGENLLSSPAGQTRRLLYNAYLFLIMVIECYYRHYATNDQENWTRPQLIQVLEQLA
jgi:aminoglycoside phosphotransferase (APT) family kinase protein